MTTERDIMAEVPVAAREEAERFLTARVMYDLCRTPETPKVVRLFRAEWGEVCGRCLAGALAVCAKEGLR